MKLQAGKRYRRRDGTITPPLAKCYRDDWLIDPEHGYYFAKSDEPPSDDFESDWNCRVSGLVDMHDLMEEV